METIMPKNIPVLIIGAGPTGLAMATILHRHGIEFRIIEKKSEQTQHSNALGIHACTLEILEDLHVVEPFLAEGSHLTQTCFYVNGRRIASMNLRLIDSPYPFVLILPQSQTEKILNNHLTRQHIQVERDVELLQIEKNHQHYLITVKQQGQPGTFSADWVIACDGAHSKVRELLNIPFKGDEIPQQFVIADVKAMTDLALNKIHAFYSSQGLIAFFPLPSGDFRIIADLPVGEQKTLDEIDLQALIRERSHQSIKITHCIWKSTFWIHSKVIANMQHDRVFFAGDAAHIHSPVGGQGMNSGIQDVYNLGWKLALVIKGAASQNILSSYNEERYPIARDLVHDTDRLTRIMLSRNPLIKFLRNWLIRPITHLKSFNYKMANRISMLSLSYQQSSIINYKSAISNRSPQPGERVPYVHLLHPYHLNHYLHGTQHQLLIFAGKNPAPQDLQIMADLIERIKDKYYGRVQHYVVTQKRLMNFVSQLSDDNFVIHKAFNINRPALCLVRPDKYIAYCNSRLDVKGLMNYLASVLKEG